MTAEDLFGPGLDTLFVHLKGLPEPKELVGRRYPVLAGYGNVQGEQLVPFLEWPGRRPSFGFSSRIGRGTVGCFAWALDGYADYDGEDERDECILGSHTSEELAQLRQRWPWAFPSGLLPQAYVSSGDDLSPDRYWRVAGAKPVSLYWILKLYTNRSNPGEQPSLGVKFTYAGLSDRFLQALGFTSVSSERRSPSAPVKDSELRAHARALRGKRGMRFLLHHFKETRELPAESQVVYRPTRKELAWFKKNPAGEPHADLPVVVLDPSGPRRERIVAQLCVLVLQNERMPGQVHSPCHGFLREYLGRKLARDRPKPRVLEDRVQDAIVAVLKNYTGRDSSAYSFYGYVAGILNQFLRNQAREKAYRRKKGEPLLACEVAERAGVSRRYVYRLAAEGVIGHASRQKRQDRSPGGLKVDAFTMAYRFSENDAQKVSELVKERRTKTALVKLLSESRGTTRRAAQRLLERWLKSGRTLREIADELLKARRG